MRVLFPQQKLHEQALHQLNEQLQVNVLQQSQLLQAGSASSGEKTKTSKAVQQQLHQLAGQQQQLLQQISQIQMQQRQYLLACLMQPFGVPQGEPLLFVGWGGVWGWLVGWLVCLYVRCIHCVFSVCVHVYGGK